MRKCNDEVVQKQLRIISVAVLPSHRGKDYGSQMLKKALDYGLLSGTETVALEVDANNKQLIRWYESFGFEQVKVLENYYNPKKHAIKMELYLQDSSQYVVITDFETDFLNA